MRHSDHRQFRSTHLKEKWLTRFQSRIILMAGGNSNVAFSDYARIYVFCFVRVCGVSRLVGHVRRWITKGQTYDRV